MAMVLRGKADIKILETYNEERLENAENLLKTTDRFFNLVASPEPILSYLRMNIFPLVAGAAFGIDAIKKFVFPRISQIAINYRNNSLSHSEGDFSVKAGDRMPYFSVDGASIYERLRNPKFHLLTFFDGQNKAPDFASELGENADFMDFHTLPLYPNITEIFGAVESFNVLLRPDNYIGLISEDVSAKSVKRYLIENF
jgi:hypothetical protein